MPVFPLNLVAFPGMSVPLHIFEERYRAMVRHLMSLTDPADRCFVVVAIREGYEIGGHGLRSLYRVGTTVQITEVDPYDDGRFDVLAVGRERVRVTEVDESQLFLQAQVDAVVGGGEDVDASRQAARTLATFATYRAAVSRLRDGEVMQGPLPRDPEMLSYALAATCALTLQQRQQLLEMPGTADRLDLLRSMLHRELQAMRVVPSLPATEVARSRWSPN